MSGRSAVSLGLVLAVMPAAWSQQPATRSIFRHPAVHTAYSRLTAEADALMKEGNYFAAAARCREMIELAPQYPSAHYTLASALARRGDKEDAFAALAAAIERGVAEPRRIKDEEHLKSLRSDPRFARLLEKADQVKPLVHWPAKVEPAEVKDGRVTVGEKNTAWDFGNGVFRMFVKADPASREKAVHEGGGEAGDLLRAWWKEGTAAGNAGDLYDNHDTDHSVMSLKRFPQLARVDFAKEVKDARLHHGLQGELFFDRVVIGNSSTALVGGGTWRSQPRYAMINPRLMRVLYNHYASNHLYFYPEHHDHDPGHNGQGGYGDVYPANTPYLVVSQGSSGSDRPFMDAVACTLAAFRPEVKELLRKEGTLMPTVQMILRASNKNVTRPADYLTGKAHPPVFDAANLDVVKMIKMAHDLKRDEVPPMVQLRVTDEDRPVLRRDYFDETDRGEVLFDTPAAIARVLRSSAFSRKLVVSAEKSKDANGRPLTWHWVVMRGDPKAVKVTPKNKAGSVAEIEVSYFTRCPVEAGSKMESNRIDVGVFVHNGKHYSAPGFVTFYTHDNEKRVYDEKKRIVSIDYADADAGKNYSDPLVDAKKNWRDEYERDEAGQLTGWTRVRGQRKEAFTADGQLVLEKDDRGRPTTVRTIDYAVMRKANQPPTLAQRLGEDIVTYEYASPKDRVGKVAKREKAPN